MCGCSCSDVVEWGNRLDCGVTYCGGAIKLIVLLKRSGVGAIEWMVVFDIEGSDNKVDGAVVT